MTIKYDISPGWAYGVKKGHQVKLRKLEENMYFY